MSRINKRAKIYRLLCQQLLDQVAATFGVGAVLVRMGFAVGKQHPETVKRNELPAAVIAPVVATLSALRPNKPKQRHVKKKDERAGVDGNRNGVYKHSRYNVDNDADAVFGSADTAFEGERILKHGV